MNPKMKMEQSGNEIGAKGVIMTGEVLKTKSILIDSNLSSLLNWSKYNGKEYKTWWYMRNGIYNFGAYEISEAIKTNHTLTSLDISSGIKMYSFQQK